MAITKTLLVSAALLLCTVYAANVPTYNNIIAGGFTSVDSIYSNGYATFVNPSATGNSAKGNLDTTHYANGQFLPHFAGSGQFASANGFSQQGLFSVADDGSAFALTTPHGSGYSEIYYYDNTTAQSGTRLFGVNGFFGSSPPTGTPNAQINIRPASAYTGSIQSIAVVGQSPSRSVFVCFGSQNTAFANSDILVTGITVIKGQGFNGGTPALGPQLVVFQESGSAGGFLSTSGTVTAGTAPTVVTPAYSPSPAAPVPGCICSTLWAKNGVVAVQTTSGPYWYTTAPGAVSTTNWVQLTRDFSATPSSGPALSLSADNFAVQFSAKNVYVVSTNPNTITTSQTSDFYTTIYRLTAGTSGATGWTAVIQPNTPLTNITINTPFVVGNKGDSEVYFTVAQTSNLLPSFLDNTNLPVQDYVFTTVGLSGSVPFSTFNYLNKLWLLNPSSRGQLSLAYEVNGGYVVVYNGITNVINGDQEAYTQNVNDVNFYSKKINGVTKYDSTINAWVQAYGGGFDNTVSQIYSTASGLTVFIGAFTHAFQTFTGPISVYNTNKNFNRWSTGYGFGNTLAGLPDLDGGVSPNSGQSGKGGSVFGGDALVTVVVPLTLSGVPGWVVAGQFRTTDGLKTVANSIVFFSGSSGSKTAFGQGGLNGVRLSNSLNQVPEYTLFTPGTVTNVVVVDNQYLVVAGKFDIVGTQYTQNFAVYDLKANSWSTANGGVANGASAGTINSLLVVGDTVYVGGAFTVVGQNVLAKNVATYNVKTGKWGVLNRGLDGAVNKLVSIGSGDVLAVGAFVTGSGQTLEFTGVWNGDSWKPLSFFGGDQQDNTLACTEKFCFASQIDGASSLLDALVVNGDLWAVADGATGSALYKYRGGSKGWENVDGSSVRGAASNNQWGVTTNFVRGGQYLAPGTTSSTLDIWNFQPNTGAYHAAAVSNYHTQHHNFLDNTKTGVNGAVYFVAPQNHNSISSAMSVAASLSFLVAIVFALLML